MSKGPGFLILMFMGTMVFSQQKKVSGISPDGKKWVEVVMDNGLISRVTESAWSESEEDKIYLAPGLIDTQVNGYSSVSFNEPGLARQGVEAVTKALWSEGVTTYFPTLITNSPGVVMANLKVLEQSRQDPLLNHSIPGYFLEGPYISEKDGYRGVHNQEWVRDPDWEEFLSFYEASGKKIIQVGLAPERPGAIQFIRQLSDFGVVVSLAHHEAGSGLISQAVKAGASVSTHLGNGCANFIHRHDNPLWPQLANPGLTASIIADGYHLTPDELTVFFKVKGVSGLMLVSDATELAGMPPGEYEWNNKKVIKTPEGKLEDPEQGVLAGASFPIRTGIMNMIKMAGCTPEEAIRITTETPAKVYSLSGRGKIQEGFSADLILYKIKNGEMVIQKTLVRGIEVYSGI